MNSRVDNIGTSEHEVRLNDQDVRDIVAAHTEKQQHAANYAATSSPRISDVAEALNIESDEVVALLQGVREKRGNAAASRRLKILH